MSGTRNIRKYTVYLAKGFNPANYRNEGGPWLARVYCEDDHIHSVEGGVSLEVAFGEIEEAIQDEETRLSEEVTA